MIVSVKEYNFGELETFITENDSTTSVVECGRPQTTHTAAKIT